MNIHYLSSSTLISDSANSVHVMKMCDAFSALGHQVTLHGYVGDGANNDAVHAYYGTQHKFIIKRHDEKKSGLSALLWWLRAKIPFLRVNGLPSTLYAWQWLRKDIPADTDIVYSRNLFWLFGLKKSTPFIMEVHHPAKNIIERLIENRLYRRKACKGIVLISAAMHDIYMEAHPDIAEKFIVAHDGADDPGEENIVQQSAGKPFKNIGYVGQLYKGRGIDVIMKAARECADMTFHIVGGRPEAIAEFKEEQSAPNNVIFHGHQPHAKLYEFYKTFDAVLSPYQKKVAVHGNKGNTAAFMSPLKIFEYMSWGLPILCSDMPVLREVLRDGENCMLLPPDDAGAWSGALQKLSKDPGLRAKIATTAREDFMREYSWKARAENILKTAGL